MLNAKALTAALLTAAVAVGGQVYASVSAVPDTERRASVKAVPPVQNDRFLDAAALPETVSPVVTGSVSPSVDTSTEEAERQLELAAISRETGDLSGPVEPSAAPGALIVPTPRPAFSSRHADTNVRAPRRRGAAVRVTQSRVAPVRSTSRISRERSERRTRKAFGKRTKRLINRDKIWLIGVYR